MNPIQFMDQYKLDLNGLLIDVKIFIRDEDVVPNYHLSILNISEITGVILNKIRDEFVTRIHVGKVDWNENSGSDAIRDRFKDEIKLLIKRYFPRIDDRTMEVLLNYVITQNIGLGNIDLLLKDANLEEIVVNSAKDPVWVYHRKHGWLKTNVMIPKENRIRHYATTIGRDVGKEITILKPLMDAHLTSGDRVNATLNPISSNGNTITIRKFAEKPWTITNFIKSNTISLEAAAWIWLAVQNELSMLITGGTGSGKTSALNTFANFFPPNHRIISIEDTRELTLPRTLHWVPLETRLANPEGKGEISMLDLVVNSLRMRPDRIVVGEIRKKAEAEVLFEAMHTGHSVYATLHANSVQETIDRLTHPPIDVAKILLSAISLIVVQNRNRRTGLRRTFQIAEILDNGDFNVLMQLDVKKDQLVPVNQSQQLIKTLRMFTGLSPEEIKKSIVDKTEILKWLVKHNVDDVHQIGQIVAKYYLGKLKIGPGGEVQGIVTAQKPNPIQTKVPPPIPRNVAPNIQSPQIPNPAIPRPSTGFPQPKPLSAKEIAPIPSMNAQTKFEPMGSNLAMPKPNAITRPNPISQSTISPIGSSNNQSPTINLGSNMPKLTIRDPNILGNLPPPPKPISQAKVPSFKPQEMPQAPRPPTSRGLDSI